jgi:hypothetical protein
MEKSKKSRKRSDSEDSEGAVLGQLSTNGFYEMNIRVGNPEILAK